jgi:hypothetical protein
MMPIGCQAIIRIYNALDDLVEISEIPKMIFSERPIIAGAKYYFSGY